MPTCLSCKNAQSVLDDVYGYHEYWECKKQNTINYYQKNLMTITQIGCEHYKCVDFANLTDGEKITIYADIVG
jgi:hypothetical protein